MDVPCSGFWRKAWMPPGVLRHSFGRASGQSCTPTEKLHPSEATLTLGLWGLWAFWPCTQRKAGALSRAGLVSGHGVPLEDAAPSACRAAGGRLLQFFPANLFLPALLDQSFSHLDFTSKTLHARIGPPWCSIAWIAKRRVGFVWCRKPKATTPCLRVSTCSELVPS